MKIYISILLFFLALSIKGQDKILIDYNKYCEEQKSCENIYRLNSYVDYIGLEFNLLTIGVKSVLNCGHADTGFFKISGDTLFLSTMQKKEFVEEVECDCLFNISFDIYGVAALPEAIYFNGKPIKVENSKYKESETIIRNGNSELVFDNCGYRYRYIYTRNESLETVCREKGMKKQMLTFDAKGNIVEISTMKGNIDSVRSVKIL